jgi:hypothetical protein
MDRIVQFDEWYFSYEYQIPFTFSVFAISFLLSNALPLISILGAFFFAAKFYIEFEDRILFQHLTDVIHKSNRRTSN